MARPATIPLSGGQRRLWFLNRLGEDRSAYNNIPIVCRVPEEISTQALTEALHDVMERHESLRTVFPTDDDGVPLQLVLPPDRVGSPLTTVQVGTGELSDAISSAARQGFNLEAELPLRAVIFHGPSGAVLLLVVIHHIAFDGWSLGPFTRDLATAYAARASGRAPTWPSSPLQYADYTLRQQQVLGDEYAHDSLSGQQLSYWADALKGIPEHLALPTDRPRPAVSSYRGELVRGDVPSPVHRQILRAAADNRASLFMFLQAAVAALLTSIGAGTDIPIGAPISGRSDETMNDAIGYFVNTLVLCCDTSGEPSFQELLARVRAVNLSAYAHQDVPFDRLVSALNPVRSLSTHPLFQVMVSLQHTGTYAVEAGGFAASVEPVTKTAKCDLSFVFTERRSSHALQGIDCEIEYSEDLFDRVSAERLSSQLLRLLEAVAEDPGGPVGRADPLDLPNGVR
jgi:hypothetical protein